MTTLSVIDTETTGDGEFDQVCELAVVTVPLALYTGLPGEITRWSTLIRPTVPVDVRARAVHHITDEELAGAPYFDAMLKLRGLDELQDDRVLVAHNLEFDLKMFRQTMEAHSITGPAFPRRICTWRCAMHLWQDAPSHKLQVLRYWLGLDEQFIALKSVPHVPHRALFDANVCAALLLRMLEFNTVEELERLTREPVLLSTVRFGEHEGKPWSRVPRDYLQWIVRQGPEQPRVEGQKKRGWDRDTLHTATHYLDRYDGRLPLAAAPPVAPEPGEGGR